MGDSVNWISELFILFRFAYLSLRASNFEAGMKWLALISGQPSLAMGQGQPQFMGGFSRCCRFVVTAYLN